MPVVWVGGPSVICVTILDVVKLKRAIESGNLHEAKGVLLSRPERANEPIR
jgi:hypothetical protein